MTNLNEYIHESKKFELIRQSSDGTRERYVSQFLSDSADFLTVSTPRYNDKTCTLLKDEVVELYVYTPRGVYCLVCKVLKREGDTYKLSLPLKTRHSQRREFLRVKKNCRANVQVHKPNGTAVTISALTYDLGGGGMSILLDAPLGDYLKIKVQLLLDEQTIETLSELVHTKPVKTAEGTKYQAAFMFISISNKEIDAIVKECLLFQLQEKNKKLKI
ncbi:flagellar brake protein YcgR [Candidatus Gastranaerophilus sp. (ex Termes propinquus)]|nr:flagellar brake protein YcgR [Candidatus Gastranaerophilus sp. (ex Termes propinquus)]